VNRFKLHQLGILLVATTLLALLLISAVSAQMEPRSTITVLGPNGPVTVGQSFPIQIRIDHAANLGAFEFRFVSNSAVAEASASTVQLGDFLGSTNRTTGELRLDQSTPGPMYGAYSYGTTSGPSGSGLLASLSVHAVGVGSTLLTLDDVQITDIEGVPLSLEVVGSSVSVQSGSPRHPIYLPVLLRQQGG
jgi:hypothetical protein